MVPASVSCREGGGGGLGNRIVLDPASSLQGRNYFFIFFWFGVFLGKFELASDIPNVSGI